MINFRQTFSPTQNEIQKALNFVESVRRKNNQFLVDQGFKEDEINLLYDLEGHETMHLRTFESYESRVYLLKNGIATVEQVKRDIQAWRDRG